jgi:hypothetical protein
MTSFRDLPQATPTLPATPRPVVLYSFYVTSL